MKNTARAIGLFVAAVLLDGLPQWGRSARLRFSTAQTGGVLLKAKLETKQLPSWRGNAFKFRQRRIRPCSPANSCDLIREEIKRSCDYIGSGAQPAFCNEWPLRPKADICD
jgi:hypothetical protein